MFFAPLKKKMTSISNNPALGDKLQNQPSNKLTHVHLHIIYLQYIYLFM